MPGSLTPNTTVRWLIYRSTTGRPPLQIVNDPTLSKVKGRNSIIYESLSSSARFSCFLRLITHLTSGIPVPVFCENAWNMQVVHKVHSTFELGSLGSDNPVTWKKEPEQKVDLFWYSRAKSQHPYVHNSKHCVRATPNTRQGRPFHYTNLSCRGRDLKAVTKINNHGKRERFVLLKTVGRNLRMFNAT